MGEEYSSSGFQGSLLIPSITDILTSRERETYPPTSDYATKNYPPPGDTTSSGGRRTGPVTQPDSGLANQHSIGGSSGADTRGQLRDLQQGLDPSGESLETRKEAAEALAARYRASLEQLHEAGDSGVKFGA